MTIGNVVSLWTYPTKGLRALEHARVEVLAEGLAGDRQSALMVTSLGHARAGKTYRGKEDNRLHTIADVDAAVVAAGERGVEVELHEGERYFDAGAVSILFDTWIADGARLCGVELEPLRFRPNIYARAAGAFSDPEATLVGRRLRAGGCLFEVTAAILRCVTPSYDLQTGVSDPKIARAIAQSRANVMGIYCSVLAPGPLATGDPISFHET